MQPQPTAPPGVRPRPGGPASRQHLPGRSRGRRCRSGPAPRPRRRPLEGSTGWSQAQPPVKRHTAHWGRLRAWGRARVAPSHAPHTAPRGSWRKQLQRRRRSPGGDPVLTLLTEELLNTAPGRGPQAASMTRLRTPQTCGPAPSCPGWASGALRVAQKRGHLLFAACPITACSRGPALSSSQDDLVLPLGPHVSPLPGATARQARGRVARSCPAGGPGLCQAPVHSQGRGTHRAQRGHPAASRSQSLLTQRPSPQGGDEATLA